MKKYGTLLLLHVLCLSQITIKAMETVQNKVEVPQGPMDYEWFYNTDNLYALANRYHQEQDWQKASDIYSYFSNLGSEYDRNKARLNLAACLMALRKETEHWAAFDALLNINESKTISVEKIAHVGEEKDKKSVLVRTDQVGIGDIFHFFSAANELKNRTGWYVIMSVPGFLKQTLASAADEYGFELVGGKDIQPITNYETHLISLLGHLKLTPAQMIPEKVVFTAPERAMNVVLEQITPMLEQGNTVAAVFLGEDRQATFIGGKKLPYNTKNHGRHLNSAPFNELLKKHSKLTLMDCGTKTSRVIIDDEQKNQYMIIPEEQQPFDTLIAFARIMSAKKQIVGFGADNGPTNVFARSLDHEAQNRMALIIPNAQEHDMRMEGPGEVYKQMISNCWVYKCPTPWHQTECIGKAYQHMLEYTQ